MSTTPKLGVTEITNEAGINEFLGLNPPKFDLSNPQKVVTENTTPNKKETVAGKEFTIDESQLFIQDPANNAEKVDPIIPEVKKDETTVGENIKEEDTPEEGEIFSQLGAGLVKMGILTTPENDDKFTWTQESFVERLEEAKVKGAEAMVTDFLENVENGTELFQALFVDRVPIEKYAGLSKAIVDFSTIDITTTAGENQERNQVKVITEYLKALGQEEGEINSRLDWLKDTNKLDEYAGNYKKKLVDKIAEERQNEQAKAKALEANKLKEKNDFQASMAQELRAAVLAKEIDGLPITNTEAEELFVYATKPAYRVPSTGQELSEFDKAFMELKKDSKKFIKLVKLVRSGLEIKDAVKVQSSKETNKIFNNLKRSARVGGANNEDLLSVLKGDKQ